MHIYLREMRSCKFRLLSRLFARLSYFYVAESLEPTLLGFFDDQAKPQSVQLSERARSETDMFRFPVLRNNRSFVPRTTREIDNKKALEFAKYNISESRKHGK